MSYLDKLSKRAGLMSHLTHGVIETAEYAGASYGFGYVQNRWREKASIKGVPADLLAGIALKAVALAGQMTGYGGALAPHVDTVGSAGIGAFFHTLGAGHGAHAAGVYRLLLTNPADKAKALTAFPGATILGDLGKAPRGDFLSASELAAMAR